MSSAIIWCYSVFAFFKLNSNLLQANENNASVETFLKKILIY